MWPWVSHLARTSTACAQVCRTGLDAEHQHRHFMKDKHNDPGSLQGRLCFHAGAAAKSLHRIYVLAEPAHAAFLLTTFASAKPNRIAPGPPEPKVTVSCLDACPCTLPRWAVMM